jgi:hypothetical protein
MLSFNPHVKSRKAVHEKHISVKAAVESVVIASSS